MGPQRVEHNWNDLACTCQCLEYGHSIDEDAAITAITPFPPSTGLREEDGQLETKMGLRSWTSSPGTLSGALASPRCFPSQGLDSQVIHL